MKNPGETEPNNSSRWVTDSVNHAEAAIDHIPEMCMTPREAWFREKETVPLCAAEGRISGVSIAPYPPGIPVIQSGERIDATVMELLLACQRQKLPVHIVGGGSLEEIRVIREDIHDNGNSSVIENSLRQKKYF